MHRKFLAVLTVLLTGCATTPVANTPPTDAADPHATELLIADPLPLSLDAPTTAPAITLLYTCPMHPSVISNHPGKCPICGMALEPKAGGK